MRGKEWLEQLPCSVIVCDRRYRVLYMNAKAIKDHAEDGGKGLVGSNLMDCHPPEAQVRLKEVMSSGRPNIYTSQKGKKRKLIYQCQWKSGMRNAGLVQLVFELPSEVPNHVTS